jgi:hypothetical protein
MLGAHVKGLRLWFWGYGSGANDRVYDQTVIVIGAYLAKVSLSYTWSSGQQYAGKVLICFPVAANSTSHTNQNLASMLADPNTRRYKLYTRMYMHVYYQKGLSGRKPKHAPFCMKGATTHTSLH